MRSSKRRHKISRTLSKSSSGRSEGRSRRSQQSQGEGSYQRNYQRSQQAQRSSSFYHDGVNGRSYGEFPSRSGAAKGKSNRSEIEQSIEARRQKRIKKRKTKRIILRTIPIVLVALVFLGVGAFGYKIYNFADAQLNQLDYRELDRTDLEISQSAEDRLKDYKNIAVLGIDTREGEDDEKCRTDAIIVATVDKKDNLIKLTSISRDSYLLVDEAGRKTLDKINHAHAYGGPEGTIRALNRNCDLNIDSFVRVNWETVADAVDAMGGVVLPVKDYEINELNKYIVDTNKNLHGDGTLITKAGKQRLNGIQAVTYCRIRKVGNGDAERAERMRRTLEAMLRKVRTMDPENIKKLANEIMPKITTNLTNREIMGLGIKAIMYDIKSKGTFPYVEDGTRINGISYTVPITLEKNVAYMQKVLFKDKKYKVSDEIKEISNRVIRETGFTGSSYPDPGEET